MSYREQYLKRKEYHKQHNKKYREIHGERLNELSKKRNKEAWHDMDDPYFFKRRLSALKGRAKANKLDFDLDADYLRKILPKDNMSMWDMMKESARMDAKKGDYSGMRQIKKTLHDDYKRSGGKWMSRRS